MGLFFQFLKGRNINTGVALYRETNEAVLLDVRTPQEYTEGHIPGSVNVPLQALERLREKKPGGETPLFVYCRSGVRSRQAAAQLQKMGYSHVTDIGGILNYRGPVRSGGEP